MGEAAIAMEYRHQSVMLRECTDSLNIRPDGIYLDGTLGWGGHSFEIARRLDKGRLIAIDRDKRAIAAAKSKLAGVAYKVIFVHGNFRDLDNILDKVGLEKVDGMIFDLGVSSPQLSEPERGFSYSADALLDMRMDETESLTAWGIVNLWPEEKLKFLLYEYGEERYARQIAKAIIRRRRMASVDTTSELVEIIKSAVPSEALREKQHPAKRSFMAIRIAVNDELSAVSALMERAPERLNPGGRLAVISFHSLEDRIVKTSITAREKGCTCPRDFPVCTCGFKRTLKCITKKPIIPSNEEVEVNPRSRSARLRVAEKV
ncbi:MAG: 16S rRNA (cytosine(1402)-N(4))-methyltransferase RsmH [Oscillospiraceae bacterium]|nr:16S rRNA (cytosine(1402)-N(4))-methyltransferase RsmH [Oscillospiraceae bacterium]